MYTAHAFFWFMGSALLGATHTDGHNEEEGLRHPRYGRASIPAYVLTDFSYGFVPESIGSCSDFIRLVSCLLLAFFIYTLKTIDMSLEENEMTLFIFIRQERKSSCQSAIVEFFFQKRSLACLGKHSAESLSKRGHVLIGRSGNR